jgi:hypothetical protein
LRSSSRSAKQCSTRFDLPTSLFHGFRLFDFELPARQNITETVTLLARMARFIIADLTDPSSIPQELQAIIPSVRVPIQPLLLEGSSIYSMFKDFDPLDFHWVLPVYQYKKPKQLLATLAEVIASRR